MEHKEVGRCKTVSLVDGQPNVWTDSEVVIPMRQSVYAGDKKAPTLQLLVCILHSID